MKIVAQTNFEWKQKRRVKKLKIMQLGFGKSRDGIEKKWEKIRGIMKKLFK